MTSPSEQVASFMQQGKSLKSVPTEHSAEEEEGALATELNEIGASMQQWGINGTKNGYDVLEGCESHFDTRRNLPPLLAHAYVTLAEACCVVFGPVVNLYNAILERLATEFVRRPELYQYVS